MATSLNTRNKWINQRIQKKHNRIQYASKHYGSDQNDIIFKRKNPLKQRRHRKKFKAQRARKKIYKQMAFDYDDFIRSNKHENYRRIQTRPTIQYYQDNTNTGIASICQNHYDSAYQESIFTNNLVNKSRIDGAAITMQFYYPQSQSTNSYVNTLDHGNRAILTGNRWNWRNHIPQSQTQETDDLQRAIAASLDVNSNPYNINHKFYIHNGSSRRKQSKWNRKCREIKCLPFAKTKVRVFGQHVKDYPESFGHQSAKFPIWKIASYSWTLYKHNFKLASKIQGIQTSKYVDKINGGSMKLTKILDSCSPQLFPVYHVIFEFMGYDSFQIQIATVIYKLQSVPKPKSNGKSGFKGCNHRPKYEKRRRYQDYIKDVTSYIPSHIYYKNKKLDGNDSDLFYDIGEYNDSDWKTLAFYSNKKRKSKRKMRCDTNRQDGICDFRNMVILAQHGVLHRYYQKDYPNKDTIMTVHLNKNARMYFQVRRPPRFRHNVTKCVSDIRNIPIMVLSREINDYYARFRYRRRNAATLSNKECVQLLAKAKNNLDNFDTNRLMIAMRNWKKKNVGGSSSPVLYFGDSSSESESDND